MPRNPHDQFAKQFLEELLTPFGQVELSLEILGESRWVDLWFQPNSQVFDHRPSIDLGVLGTMTQAPCLLEPYRNAPNFDDIRSCLSKHYAVVADQKRKNPDTPEADLPHQWILVPTFSERSCHYCGASLDRLLPRGFYQLPPLFGTHIVVIHQLPKTPQTLWLRLLGKGHCQREAIEEVIALPQPDPQRDLALELLANWKIILDNTSQASEEEETFMVLSQAYREWELKTIQIGEQRGIQIGEQRGIQIGEQRGIEQQHRMLLELLEMELDLKFGVRGQALMPYLEEVEGLTDLYGLVKAIKPMTEWQQVQDWWFDRLPAMMAEGDRLNQWLGVALKLRFPEADPLTIAQRREELGALPWEDAQREVPC